MYPQSYMLVLLRPPALDRYAGSLSVLREGKAEQMATKWLFTVPANILLILE